MKNRKTAVIVGLLGFLVGCGVEETHSVGDVDLSTYTHTHTYIDTQPEPLKIDLQTTKTTEDFIRAVIAIDQECLQAQGLTGTLDTNNLTIVVLDTYAQGREVCPGGDGCFVENTKTIFVPFGNSYGEAWDAELLAHELNHVFLGENSDPHDYDAGHTHSQVFGRRDGTYGWEETNHKTVSECVAVAFGG